MLRSSIHINKSLLCLYLGAGWQKKPQLYSTAIFDLTKKKVKNKNSVT